MPVFLFDTLLGSKCCIDEAAACHRVFTQVRGGHKQHILWQLCKYLPFNCLNLFRRGLKIGDISTHDKQSGKDVNINCSHFRLSH